MTDTGSNTDTDSFYVSVFSTTRYVDPDSPGPLHNGVDWTNAFVTLQDALEGAGVDNVTEIWVADGVYKPSPGVAPCFDNNDCVGCGSCLNNLCTTACTDPRKNSFGLRTGVKIYGGFQGSGGCFAQGETELGQRDPLENETILSGDIGTGGSIADNSYHVVSAIGVGLDGRLDGFVIELGNADTGVCGGCVEPPSVPYGDINSCDWCRGGGIYLRNASPIIANCTVRNNEAEKEGGGVVASIGSLRLSNLVVQANTSAGGGGVAVRQASLDATNSLFLDNSTTGLGGAIQAFSGIRLTNSTVAENTASVFGGGLALLTGTGTARNSIFWGNVDPLNPPAGKQIYVNTSGGAVADVNYSCIQGNTGSPPPFPGSNISANPSFVNAAMNDFRLNAGSPAINIGHNPSVLDDWSDLDSDGDTSEGTPLDLDRRPRILEGNVDLGPFETGAVSSTFAYFCFLQKLTNSTPPTRAAFGSVSVSGDAMVVGAFLHDCPGVPNCGSASVFRFNGSAWVEEQRLTASDIYEDKLFGQSVAIEGDTIVVGAPDDNCLSGFSCGSAYVFRFNGSSWAEEQKLTAADPEEWKAFGDTVSIEGDTIVVGAPNDDCLSGFNCGSAYVFRFNGSSWVQEQKLTASDGCTEHHCFFGGPVSVSGDVVMVGASGVDCPAGADCGSVYVYQFDGNVWAEVQKLTAADAAAGDHFGAVSVNGNVAVVGALHDACANGAPTCGSAYVYRFDGSTWVEEQKLRASDAAQSDIFGGSVSLSGDFAVVSAQLDDIGTCENCGSVYVYRYNGITWVEQQKLTAADGATSDNFGRFVSISGNTVATGTFEVDCPAGISCGAAYVFEAVFSPGQRSLAGSLDGNEHESSPDALVLSGNDAMTDATRLEKARAILSAYSLGFCAANEPPTADAGGDASAPLGSSVMLDGSGSTDPEGPISWYLWSYGDLEWSGWQASPLTSHTYADPGTYTATLWVRDGCDVVSLPSTVQVDVIAPTLVVTSPNGGGSLSPNAAQTVTWTEAHVSTDVGVVLLKDGGVYQALGTVPAGTNSLTWNICEFLGDGDYRVQVSTCEGGRCFSDSSDGVFSVTGSVPRPTLEFSGPHTGSFSAGAAMPVTVSWTATDPSGDVVIELLRAGNVVQTVGTARMIDGSFPWTIYGGLGDASDYTLRVSRCGCGSCIRDGSDGMLTITGSVANPTLSLTSPVGGESWNAGSSQTITWMSTNPIGDVGIELLRPGREPELLGTAPMTVGGFAWTICAGTKGATDYTIKLRQLGCGPCVEHSSPMFTIMNPSPTPTLQITQPNGAQNWTAGSTQQIQWNSTNPVGEVTVSLLKDGVVVDVLGSASMSAESFTWPIGAAVGDGNDYGIQIGRCECGDCVQDASDANFSIAGSSPPDTIQLSSLNGGQVVTAGSIVPITWQSSSNEGEVSIQLYKLGLYQVLLGTANPADGAFDWEICSAIGDDDDYTIRLSQCANGACFESSSTSYFEIVGSAPAPTIQVISPNGGESWQAGDPQTITWLATNPSESLEISLVGDDGSHFSIGVVDMADEVFEWEGLETIGDGTDYRIQLTSCDCRQCVSDTSDNVFSIMGSLPAPSLEVTSPIGGESWAADTVQTITWDAVNPHGDVLVEVLSETGSTALAVVPMSSGQFQWTICRFFPSGATSIVVRSAELPDVLDTGDEPFEITGSQPQPSFSVVSPNGGESWSAGTTQTIEWSSTNPSSEVVIELVDESGLVATLTAVPMAAGEFDWALCDFAAAGNDYRILLSQCGCGPCLLAESAATFTIIGGGGLPTIEVTSPNGSETINAGTTFPITWNATNASGLVHIALMKDGLLDSLLGTVDMAAEQFSWEMCGSVPDGSDYSILVTSDCDAVVSDESDGPFTITGAGMGGQDADQDGVVDACDNCPGVPNPSQVDSDQNGIGDACACTVQLFGDIAPIGAPDGIVELGDVLCMLAGYANEASCPGSDIGPCGGDGIVELSDVLAILAAYAGNAPCPNQCL